MEPYDVCIIGAGLTGCLNALLLHKKGLKVCLLEKNNGRIETPNSPVWETVPQSFFDRMPDYGLDATPLLEITEVTGRNGAFISAWGTTRVVSEYDTRYYHINKPCLNRYLRSAIANAGIPLYINKHPSFSFRDHSWQVKLDAESLLSVKLIIDATGRNSFFAARQGVRKIFFDDHYALFRSASNLRPGGNQFILESAQNGWWYSNAVGDSVQAVLISSLSLINRSRKNRFYTSALQDTYFIKRYQQVNQQAPVVMKDCRSGILAQTRGQHWIALGDSAFSLDPLAGSGNTTILKTSLALSDQILSFIQTGNDHCLQTIDMINNREYYEHLTSRQKYYALEKRWARSHFWKLQIA